MKTAEDFLKSKKIYPDSFITQDTGNGVLLWYVKDLLNEYTTKFASPISVESKVTEEKPKYTAAKILEWIQDGHAVAPGGQANLLNYMIAFVNHFNAPPVSNPDIKEIDRKADKGKLYPEFGISLDKKIND